ncbi:MAG TPA: M48 family metalloprotease [Caulobacteraceae bacterium]|jgi:predicted Zn-dependent protease
MAERRAARVFAVSAAALGLAAGLFASSFAQAQSLIRDTEIEEILHEQADPIFQAAGLEPKDVEILIVNDKELNAFATQGQIIGLHTGLILETKTPNQLNGVIAHETGHLAGGHTVRGGEMMRAGLKPFILSMGLGVLAAFAGQPGAGAALMASSGQFGTLGALGYSRVQEGAADQAGATYLEKAGQSGKGLVEFFNSYRYQEVFSEARRYAYFRSHPLSADRIGRLQSRVSKSPHHSVADSPEAIAKHALMKAKLEAFLNPAQQTFVKYKEKDTSFPARYARAIAYYRGSEPDKALKAVDALLQEQPANPYLWELKGQILFENGRVKEAEAPHRKSVELKPTASLLRVNLAQTLLAIDTKARGDEAIAELDRALLLENDNSFAWRLLSQAYDAKGDDGRARLAAAEAHFALRDEEQARIFAMRAREKLEKGSPQWRRATDIVLASDPSKDDLEAIGESRRSAR